MSRSTRAITNLAGMAATGALSPAALAKPLIDRDGSTAADGFSAPVVIETQSGLDFGSAALGAGSALLAVALVAVVLIALRRHRGQQLGAATS